MQLWFHPNNVSSKVLMTMFSLSFLPGTAFCQDTLNRMMGKHNLSLQTGLAGNGTEVCTFCHTPYGNDQSANTPLWKNVSSAEKTTPYVTFDTLGINSQSKASSSVGSVSLSCLSCHDGTQAMDTSLNLPTSGGRVTSFGGGAPQLEHPVGIKYAGGGYSADNSFNSVRLDGNTLDFTAPSYDYVNSVLTWWVDTKVGAKGFREKSDMQLYSRSLDGGISSEPFVECASCHDPHSRYNTFLRMDNQNDSICKSCHSK